MPTTLTAATLDRRRDEAEAKAAWFRFVVDAWEGSGGFAPRVESQRVSAIGGTYLDTTTGYVWRHGREGPESYARRAAHARYTNRLRFAIGHWIGLLLRRAPSRTGATAEREDVQTFLADADGAGTAWDDLLRQWVTRSLLFAGAPLLVDAEPSGGSPFARLLDPRALYDWQRGSRSEWEWAKIVDTLSVCESATDDRQDVTRAAVWTPEDVSVWIRYPSGQVTPDDDASVAHGLGVVPLAWLSYDDPISDELWGWTPAAVLACLGREELNDHARLLDIHEQQTFSQLCVPVAAGAEGKELAINSGTTAVFTYAQGSGSPSYLAPPDGPVTAHERKLDRDRADVLQVLGLEMLLQSTAAPTSGVARQYEFQHLNAGLARFARRAAAAEREVIRLVLRWSGRSAEQAQSDLGEYSVEWPEDFDVRDRQADLELAERVLGLPGIDRVTKRAVLRGVRVAVVQMTPAEIAAAESEADEVEKAASEAARLSGPTATEVELAPTDQAAVVSVNEARASVGLGPLLDADGAVSADGYLSVEAFRARAAAPAAPPTAAPVVEPTATPAPDDAAPPGEEEE